VVEFAALPVLLPYHDQSRITAVDYRARIAARQAAAANRMVG
jgi:hypothetical protein